MCHFVLVFFSPFSIAITSLGEERANLSAFRTFVRFVLVWICRFPLPLGVWEGLRYVIVALPGLFSYLFFYYLPLMKKIRYIFLKSYVKLTLGTHGQWADVNQNQGKRPTTPGVTFLDRFYNLPLMKIFCHAFLKNCKG